ncbi:MAG: transcription-repair coupling factor [Gammaproteobacteria bacterium]
MSALSSSSAHPFEPPLPAAAGAVASWGQLYGAASALVIAAAARRAPGPLIVVTAGASEVERLAAEIAFFAGSALPVLTFPDWETLAYDAFSPHQDIISERLRTLKKLPTLRQGVILTAAATLLQRLPPPAFLDAHTLLLEPGQRLDPSAMRVRLEAAGYVNVPQVAEHGEFAVRGALLDVFPMGALAPYRIDLFDDEIESLRCFDPETQLSTETVARIELLPAREFPFDESSIRSFRQRWRQQFEGDPQQALVYRDVSNGITPGGVEYWLPLFFDDTATLFDYLPDDAVLAEAAGTDAAFASAWSETATRYEQLSHDRERPLLPPERIQLTPDELATGRGACPRIDLQPFELVDDGVNFATRRPPMLLIDARADEPTAALRAHLESFGGRVLIAAESPGRREMLLQLLAAHNLRPDVVDDWQAFRDGDMPLALVVAPLEYGMVLDEPSVSLIAEGQLYGERVRQQRRRRAVRDPESIIRDLTDLRAGTPVVHVEHGVGRYLGLQTLTVDGLTNEFLALEYAGGDKLYVPVAALHLVTRYTGAAPEHAPLHRLGSDRWDKARRKAAEKLRDVAAELLEVQARRAARVGHAYRIDTHDYAAFAAGFPFEATPDQQQAIDAVLADLAAASPMDRVVCGDVGFGKTEVALRAAFVAVQDGKQVAVLVPTTLLAQQHWQTFSDRFADWPVRIELMSRMRSGKQQAGTLTDLLSGKVDIVIGTHALLGNRVKFGRLGLVIVDEEHRFGVRHKEQLKKLRAEVDLLTLTATPIPRTLNMTLAGLRDLSIIATPPEGRLTIKTFVSGWNDTLIRDACLREIRRGGQVYLLHNEVETIERMGARIAALVPEASMRIAHGQMRERDLEQTMLDFYHRRFNVLVCTTIIESGIDVPSANTIIVNRADKLGLAQLHQLRGRVGRSHHRAYAYLLTPDRDAMTADALKRLEAIESLEDLGAGFTLATHDLEIRGAGELLGDEQSGQIEEIGFTMYNDLLARAVDALKRGDLPDSDPLEHDATEVDLRLAALLPADYVPDVHTRLILYKRVSSAADSEALYQLQVELIDRFGLLPEPTKNLFRVAEIRLAAKALGIRRLEAGPAGCRVVFSARPAVDPATVIGMVQERAHGYRFDGQQTLRCSTPLPDPQARIAFAGDLIKRLGGPPR